MHPVTSDIIKKIKTDIAYLSLYIHIPLCRKKCFYCDFYSIVLTDKKKEKEIINLIADQLSFFKEKYKTVITRTISIGGGTPSILQRNILILLFKSINSFTANFIKEFTIEANPESIDKEFIDLCKKNNVTRISLGIQSFHDPLLMQLGRITNNKMNTQALELLTKFWNRDLNIDLITGIPGQSKKMLITDIKKALSYNPAHISLYALTIEEGTELYKMVNRKRIIPLHESIQEDLWFTGMALLKHYGYFNYEISNFAKPGKMCIHNINYWKMNPYLGIGPGAVSTIPAVRNKIIRFYNPHDIKEYLKSNANNFWNLNYEYISSNEFLLENLIMGFRLNTGINKNQFVNRFGRSFNEFFPDIYKRWKEKSIIKETKTTIAINDKDRLFLNKYLGEIYEEFDALKESVIDIHWPD